MSSTALYPLFQLCTEVITDSRNCTEGAMFFALKGDSFNGNAFAAQALEKGASYVVIDEAGYAVPGDSRYIVVENVLVALQQLAQHHRRQFKQLKVIGITGTNGKTTTKELVAAVLKKRYRTLYTQGNLNNHIGVPLTLLRLTPEHEMAIIEMGANHPGEIKALAEIAEPDYGLITNVGKAHLEGFGSFEGVIRTKKELYDYLKAHHAGIFIDKNAPHLSQMAEGLNQISYGIGEHLFVNGTVLNNASYLHLSWRKEGTDTYYQVKTNLIGAYNFSNVMAAIAIGVYFDVPEEDIVEAIEGYIPRNNRSQLTQTAGNTLIVDAYNANPSSMMAALQNFSKLEAPQKMIILGEMKELGEESEKEHRAVVDFFKAYHFNRVLLVGKMFQLFAPEYTTFENVDGLIAYLQKEKPEGYTILIKGSNSVNLIKAVDAL